MIGIPLARQVDRTNRKRLLAGALAVWSLACAGCGLAHNFWHLLICRMATGTEVVNGPAANSMIADYFPQDKLPRAYAIYNIGFIVGMGVSLLVGGLVIHLLSGVDDFTVPVLGQVHQWQLVFFAVGLPGLLLALLLLTVKEPIRRRTKLAANRPALRVSQILGYLFRNWRLYGPIFLAVGLSSIHRSADQFWQPTFIERTYGWTMPRIAAISGTTALVTAPVGLILGTWAAERFARAGRDDANLRVVLIAHTLAFPFAIVAPLMPNPLARARLRRDQQPVRHDGHPRAERRPHDHHAERDARHGDGILSLHGGLRRGRARTTFVAAVSDYLLPSEGISATRSPASRRSPARWRRWRSGPG